MKTCKICGEEKNIFKMGRCYDCFMEYKRKKDREYREKNKEWKREQDRKYRERNKERLKQKKKEEYYNKGNIRYCKNCKKEFRSPKWVGKKFCSKKCQGLFWKKNGFHRLSDNPVWKNGNHSTTYRKIFINHLEEQGVDIEKMGCQICGVTTAMAYDIHHIVYRSEAPNHPKLNDPINMVFVCRSCHNYLHYRKNKRDSIVKERGLEEVFNKQLYDRD